MSPNFAVRVFELDPAYEIVRIFAALGIVDLKGAQRARWEPRRPAKLPALEGAP